MSIILKTPDKTNQLLTRKNVLLILGCLTVFILFKKSVESLLSNTVVNYLFNQVESIWYNDIIFFLITFIPIFFIFYRYRNYTPSNHITILILITSIIYLFYRIEGATWEFTPFSLYFKIKYADTLLIISICQLLLYIPRKKITPNIENNSFFDDNSLGKIGNDELGYSSYAELLGEKILSSHFEKSFAIGINGKWGAGKTSFIDLLKRKVQNDNIIEINFNPWNNHSPKAIIKDFFETVQESIRPYHSSLSRLFIQYSNKLVDLNSNTVTQSIQTTVSAISGFDSLNSLYQDINTALVSIDKKIIVYIDDLDRLDKHEIIEVIRLIRNTANFYNTFFIVAYDRNYVVNALKQHNPYKQEEFLEKIFQIEITLPFYKKDILRYKLAEKLKTKLPEIDFTTIDNAVIGTPSSIPVFLNEWLESMRDVTRLANAILLNLNKIKGEVVFNDLLRIELLRLKYPSSYELLSKRETEFLDTESEHGSRKQHYKLKNISKKEVEPLNETEPNIKTYFELHLYRNHSELSIPKNDIPKIVDFVNTIFGGGYSFNYYSKSHLSIIYPSKFNHYFAYKLLDGALSEIEFSKARSLNQKDFNAKITEWIINGLELELKSRFSEIKFFDNRDDFEKIIKAIFYLANQSTQRQNFFSRDIIGYDGKDLKDKLSNFENRIIDKFYPEKNGKNTFKKFVINLFKNAKSPYTFEADFIRHVNNVFSEDFILNKEELKSIVIDYFRKYCNENNKLDYHVWHLFHSCKQTDWVPTGHNTQTKQETMPIEVTELMKDFLLNKDFDGFLLTLIKVESFDRKTFAISELAIDLFDDWETFEKVLTKKDEEDSNFLHEFKKFMAVFASKNYSQYVDFEFKDIPIQEKINKS